MTDGEKATAVLNYLEKQNPRTILKLLDPFLDDYPLSLLYDDLKDEGKI